MAFVSSQFLGASPGSTRSAKSLPKRHLSPPRACAKNTRRPDDVRNYRPFDGSQPLLPPWRPPSVEAAFQYSAQRIISRETGLQRDARAQKRLVKVESAGFGTLFAEVVQEVTSGGGGRVWLRPLLLDGEKGTSVDVRGGSDVVLEAGRVVEVVGELRTRVTINLAATEGDLVSRVVEDERWGEAGSKALLDFMRSLAGSG